MANMDPSINPCDDFYQFACGGFEIFTLLFPEQTTVDSFSMANNRLSIKLYDLLNNETNADEPKPYRLAKTLFRGCNNKEVIRRRGLYPLRALLRKFGGWPMVDGLAWNETVWTWQTLLTEYRKEGAPWNYLFNIGYDDGFFHKKYYTKVSDYSSLKPLFLSAYFSSR